MLKLNIKLELILIVVVFSLALPFFAQAGSKSPLRLDILPPRHVFLPQGFDSNDGVEVIVDLQMPNSCYYQGKIEVKIEQKIKKIFIRNLAYFNPNQACLPIVKTTAETIQLGTLPAGNYELFFEEAEHGFKSAGILPIAQTTKIAVDDHLYAPVESLWTELKNGHTILSLTGTLTSSCMRLAEVRITAREGNMLEVLPILEKPAKICAPVVTEYQENIDLGQLAPGRSLIYVRTDGGRSKSIIEEL